MSRSDMWWQEYEQIFEDYDGNVIDREEAVKRLIALGYDKAEAKDHLDVFER